MAIVEQLKQVLMMVFHLILAIVYAVINFVAKKTTMAIVEQLKQVLMMIFRLILAIVYAVINFVAKKVPAVQKYTDEFNKCVDADGNIDKEKLEEAFKRLFPNQDPQKIKEMVKEVWGKCKANGQKVSLKDNLATLLEFVVKSLKNGTESKSNDEAGESKAKASANAMAAAAASGDEARVAEAKKEL